MFKRYIHSRPATKALVFFATLALMYAVFYWLYGKHTSAIVLVGSIALHELGHLVAYRRYGYRGGIVFLPPLGAAMIPYDQAGYTKMPEWRKAVVAFAGPAVNLVLAMGGLLLAAVPGQRGLGLMITALNGSLAAFNLLPFLITDGGKIVRALFDSADEAGDRRIVKVLTGAMWASFASLLLMASLTTMPLLFIWRVHRAADEDDPEAWRLPTAMTKAQIRVMTGAVAATAALTMFIAGAFRYWNSYH